MNPVSGRTADVVDEHVDPSVGFQARLDHRGDVASTGGVAQVGRDRTSRFFHALHGFAQPLGVAVHGEDLCALLGEAQRGRAPVAPARPHGPRAGDDRHLAFEATGHVLNP
jgi:hypothetical protein